MRKHLLYFLLLSAVIFATTCKKNKLKAPTASFLVVDNVSVNPKPGQGSSSEKITDIWYYVNGQFQGVFPIGSVMPIATTGNAEIQLFAGIKNNGISATRVPYEFYNPITTNMDLEAGKTYTLSPKFEYKSTSYFSYNCDFEVGNYFQSVGDSDAVLIIDPTKTFGGTGKSYFMGMSDAKPTAKIINSVFYYLPVGGSPVYLELNYNCNQPITVGVNCGGVEERGAITLNSTDGVWNKIYIKLTTVVSTTPTYEFLGYKVFIKATKEVANPKIYLDNIKLIN